MAKDVSSVRLNTECKSIVSKSIKGKDFTAKLQYLLIDFDKEVKVAREELKRIFSIEELKFIVDIVNESFLYGDYKTLFLESIQNINEDKEIILSIIRKFSTLNHFSVYVLINWCIQFKFNLTDSDNKEADELILSSYFL
jgi:hypothetical protein